jgi:hypothetical protein
VGGCGRRYEGDYASTGGFLRPAQKIVREVLVDPTGELERQNAAGALDRPGHGVNGTSLADPVAFGVDDGRTAGGGTEWSRAVPGS